MALRTEAGGRRAERVVRTTLRGACLGVSAFWIRHSWSGLAAFAEILERRQPRILPRRRAPTRLGIQVRPALRTQSPSVFTAQGLHLQRQVELIP